MPYGSRSGSNNKSPEVESLNEREDYLDRLLRGVEDSPEDDLMSDDDFLEEFNSSYSVDDDNDFLQEFEMSKIGRAHV